ncbi:MAG: plasmid partitioning protein RepB, partial [Hyphomicrobiales bacterium]|nr:plasmid partitioning protein RepB [Hyphomicrobiales bacterium]
ASASPAPASWAATDGRIAARMHGTAKTYDLSLRAADAAAFGAFLSARLDDLYAAFRAAENRATGD